MSLLYGAQKKKKGDAESASFIFVHTALGGWQVKRTVTATTKMRENKQTKNGGRKRYKTIMKLKYRDFCVFYKYTQ